MNKWLNIARTLAPLVVSLVKPELAPIAGKITNAIDEAEQIPGATGKEKLQHVKNIASNAADVVNQAKGKEVIEKSSLDASIQEAVDTAVAVTNLINKKSTTPE